jgi:hypothetical protein
MELGVLGLQSEAPAYVDGRLRGGFDAPAARKRGQGTMEPRLFEPFLSSMNA